MSCPAVSYWARQKHICQQHRQQELFSPSNTTVCMWTTLSSCRTWQGSTGRTSASWRTTCRGGEGRCRRYERPFSSRSLSPTSVPMRKSRLLFLVRFPSLHQQSIAASHFLTRGFRLLTHRFPTLIIRGSAALFAFYTLCHIRIPTTLANFTSSPKFLGAKNKKIQEKQKGAKFSYCDPP